MWSSSWNLQGYLKIIWDIMGGGGSTSAKYRQIGVLSKVRDETQVLKASNISQIGDETQKGCFEEE